jgi:hypothetical protein
LTPEPRIVEFETKLESLKAYTLFVEQFVPPTKTSLQACTIQANPLTIIAEQVL